MTHASLFSGIGGFDLAAQWAGIDNIFQVEIDKFCQKVLTKNFGSVPAEAVGIKRGEYQRLPILYNDIKDFNGTEYRNGIDILSGGFPCQPFSQAGKRKGNKDERALFPEMLRIIREVQPRWIVGENVSGILSIHDGEYFEEISASLENEGYKVQSFIIPASSVNAPHRRDRVWIIANTESIGYLYRQNEKHSTKTGLFTGKIIKDARCTHGKRETQKGNVAETVRQETTSELKQPIEGNRVRVNASDTNVQGLERCYTRNEIRFKGFQEQIAGRIWEQNWYDVATRLCRVDARVSNRVDRLKSLGNSIVPQIAYLIFETIKSVILTSKLTDHR